MVQITRIKPATFSLSKKALNRSENLVVMVLWLRLGLRQNYRNQIKEAVIIKSVEAGVLHGPLFLRLALTVLIGVIISALVFAWESAKRIGARKYIDESGVKHYEIYGRLFFGSVTAFNEKFDVTTDPAGVIIDFRESRVVDMSGIEALNKLTQRNKKAGKKLHLRHLSDDCKQLLKNAASVIDVNVVEDPHYRVAVDKV